MKNEKRGIKMSKKNFTPEEQKLIRSLRQMPKPILRAEALASIQQQILAETTVHAAKAKTKLVQLVISTVLIVLIVLSLTLLAIWFFLAQSNLESPTRAAQSVSSSPTAILSQTTEAAALLAPSATFMQVTEEIALISPSASLMQATDT